MQDRFWDGNPAQHPHLISHPEGRILQMRSPSCKVLKMLLPLSQHASSRAEPLPCTQELKYWFPNTYRMQHFGELARFLGMDVGTTEAG